MIFDLDGTLADTPLAIARTISAAVAATGREAPTLEAALATIGRPLDEAFRSLLPESEWGSVPECVRCYRERYDRDVVPATRLYPDVAETLVASSAAGLRLAVATTKITRIAEATLAHCGVLSCFAVVIGGDRVARPKPAPEMATLALAEMNCGPESALVVGDTTYDLGMGKAAGARTCAVTYGAHSRDQLVEVCPDYVIDRFGDLKSILGIRERN